MHSFIVEDADKINLSAVLLLQTNRTLEKKVQHSYFRNTNKQMKHTIDV